MEALRAGPSLGVEEVSRVIWPDLLQTPPRLLSVVAARGRLRALAGLGPWCGAHFNLVFSHCYSPFLFNVCRNSFQPLGSQGVPCWHPHLSELSLPPWNKAVALLGRVRVCVLCLHSRVCVWGGAPLHQRAPPPAGTRAHLMPVWGKPPLKLSYRPLKGI